VDLKGRPSVHLVTNDEKPVLKPKHTTEHLKAYQFKPGQSGNPGGREKGIAALAREHGPAALQFLADVVDGKVAAKPAERIQAAQILLDRAYGKPVITQNSTNLEATVDLSEDVDVDPALKAKAEAELKAMAAALKSLPTEDLRALASAPVESEVDRAKRLAKK
jgi:hypothetical protein